MNIIPLAQDYLAQNEDSSSEAIECFFDEEGAFGEGDCAGV